VSPQTVEDLPILHVLTLMTVTGHPDDETLWAGGVMARYAAEGLRVVCVTCTEGENGSIVVPELDTPENRARLGEIRAEELTRALARLGSIENRWLGYGDSGMTGSPQNTDPHSFWSADPTEATGRPVIAHRPGSRYAHRRVRSHRDCRLARLPVEAGQGRAGPGSAAGALPSSEDGSSTGRPGTVPCPGTLLAERHPGRR
jgi:GlcNAc-PI de-N-acetylase